LWTPLISGKRCDRGIADAADHGLFAAEFGGPSPEGELQEASDFLRTPVFCLRLDFRLAGKIDCWQFALYDGLQIK
jgi:hypothetical protein